MNRMIKFFSRLRYLRLPLSRIDKMKGIEFEEYLKAVFEKKGYKVEITPRSNDYGADRCIVVTNSYFTKNAVKLAEANDVELWDRNEL